MRSKADLHYGLCGQGKFPPALLRKAGGEFPFPPRPLPPGHSVWQGDEEFPIGGREPEWRRAATGEPREPAPLVTPQPDSSARDRSTTAHPRASRLRSAGPPAARAPQPARQCLFHLSPRIPLAALTSARRTPAAAPTSARRAPARTPTAGVGHWRQQFRPNPRATG